MVTCIARTSGRDVHTLECARRPRPIDTKISEIKRNDDSRVNEVDGATVPFGRPAKGRTTSRCSKRDASAGRKVSRGIKVESQTPRTYPAAASNAASRLDLSTPDGSRCARRTAPAASDVEYGPN